MCFAQSHFPQKSRFFLPSSFDPHGTGGGGGGLCQQSCVSAGGPGRPPECHSLLFVNAWPAKPPCGAVSCHGPTTHSASEQPALHNICEQKVWSSLGAWQWIFGGHWWRRCGTILDRRVAGEVNNIAVNEQQYINIKTKGLGDKILCWLQNRKWAKTEKCQYFKYVSPESNVKY